MAGDTLRTLHVELTGGSGALQKSLRDAAVTAGRMGIELKAVQGQLDRVTAARPTAEMKALDLAVRGLGGTANLTGAQLGRVTMQVNQLAAAGAKVPASLSGVTGIGSKLGAAFTSLGTGGGVTGALYAIGPAGIAAAAGIGVVTVAGGAAVRAVADLAQQAEHWSNVAEATGLGVETVQKLGAFLEDAGFSADDLGTMMKRLQKEITAGGPEFAKYGISLAAIKDLSPEEQLRAVAAAVTSIIDPTERAAAAQEFFGKSGAEHMAALRGIAEGTYQEMGALSDKQIEELKRLDDYLDKVGRSWDIFWKRALVGAVSVLTPPTEEEARRSASYTRAGAMAGVRPKMESLADFEARLAAIKPDETPLTLGPEEARTKLALEALEDKQAKEREKEAAAQRKKDAEELLASRKKYNELMISIVKHTEDEAGLMRELDAGSKDLLDKTNKIEKERIDKLKEGRLREGDYLPSIGGAGLWTRDPETIRIAEEDAAAAAKGTKEAKEATTDWSGTLGTLADQLQGLAQTTGGFTGSLAGLAASLSSGLGGALSGFKAMKGSTGGGLMGFLGQASGALGMVGSVVGIGMSLFKGIKGLFGGKSKEQKAAEKAAAEEAKKKAEEEALQAKIKARQDLEAGLGTAKTSAESLMALLAQGGLSEGLTKALQTIIDKVGGALLKSGLGILDARLKESKEFGAAQGMAGDVAGAIGGMRQAGMVDAGLLAAGGAAAAEIQAQAIAAAQAAGMSDMEAAKAGSAAIAQLLREQLNASLQSGNELDANTKALLDQAKANGIEILADPAIESLAVQREQLGVLKTMAGMPSGSDTSATSPTGYVPSLPASVPSFADGGWGNFGTGTVATLHGLEAVIPLDALEAGGYTGRGGDVFTIAPVFNEDPLQTFEGKRRQREFTLDALERETARDLANAVAMGRA